MFKVGQTVFVGTEFERGVTRVWGVQEARVLQVFTLLTTDFVSHYFVEYQGAAYMHPTNVGPQTNFADAAWVFGTEDAARIGVAQRIAQRLRVSHDKIDELSRRITRDQIALADFTA